MRFAQGLAAGLFLMALSAAPALAQIRPERGIEAAINWSKLSPKSPSTAGIGTGAMVGVYAVIPFLGAVAIQPELVYIQKYSSLSSASDVKLDYLEIPILARIRLTKAIYLTEGVAFGFPLRAEVRRSSGAAVDFKGHTTSPDVSTIIGGGVPIGKLGIEFRYEGGIRRLDTIPGAGIQRTRNLMLLGRWHL